MSSPELIEPHAAAYRLADEWGIPYPVAGQIVRGVLYGGREPCLQEGQILIVSPSDTSHPDLSTRPIDFVNKYEANSHA